MAADSRIGTRTDAIVFLSALVLLYGGAFAVNSGKLTTPLSWILMLPGSFAMLLIFGRVNGKSWSMAALHGLIAAAAFGASGLVGFFVEAHHGPFSFPSWESSILLAAWSALTAATYRLGLLVLSRLRRERSASG